MKKLVIAVTGIILISCVFVSEAYSRTPPRENTVSSNTSDTAEQSFIIKDSDGRVAVFREGEETPFIITETLTRTLPKNDIAGIKRGIKIENPDNLKKVIEDYCS